MAINAKIQPTKADVLNGAMVKAGDAFNGQVEEFPIISLRLAGSSCITIKKDFFLFKTNPTE